MRGGGVLLLCSALALSVVGCSFATGSRNVSGGDLTGVWVGKLTVDHVHGQAGFVRQDISFTLLQQQFAIVVFTDAGRATIRAPISTWEAGWCV